MRYSICIDAVFQKKLSFPDAMHAVKECGFHAFEFWSWWDKDIDEMVKAKKDLQLDTAAFCTKFINPGDSSEQDEFLLGLKETLENARRLECKSIIIQAGFQTEGIRYEEHRKSLLEVMKKSVRLAEQEEVTLLIESLNILVDHAGYHMWSSKDAFDFCSQIGSSNFKILYDIYHQQISEGNLTSNITSNIDKIGHFHSAGVPGRVELMNGEINYSNIIHAIKRTGYDRYFGLEYMTKEDPVQSIRDTKAYLSSIGD